MSVIIIANLTYNELLKRSVMVREIRYKESDKSHILNQVAVKSIMFPKCLMRQIVSCYESRAIAYEGP